MSGQWPVGRAQGLLYGGVFNTMTNERIDKLTIMELKNACPSGFVVAVVVVV